MGKIIQQCEHGCTLSFCTTCKKEAAKALAMARHPSGKGVA